MRKAFTFYSSYYESIRELPKINQEELYKAIVEYSFDKKEPKLTGISTSIWYLIKPNIDNNISKYENGKQPKNKGLKEIKKRNVSESEAKAKRKRSSPLSLSLSYIINKTYYSNKELDSIFKDFLKLRVTLKAVNSELAIKELMNSLSKYDDETKILMIKKSIKSSWKDVYELKAPPKTVQQDVPKWFNKEIQTNEMSKEEQEELKKELERE